MLRFIDVTLRDVVTKMDLIGGSSLLERYLKSISSFQEIDFVELGYWKQTGKYTGPFY